MRAFILSAFLGGGFIGLRVDAFLRMTQRFFMLAHCWQIHLQNHDSQNGAYRQDNQDR